MSGDDRNDMNEIKVPLTEYTKHIVMETVTEAMKQHQDSCPLIKTVYDLSHDVWGDNQRDGIKAKVRILEGDYENRIENKSLFKKPFFSGVIGGAFVLVGIILKGFWEWLKVKI